MGGRIVGIEGEGGGRRGVKRTGNPTEKEAKVKGKEEGEDEREEEERASKTNKYVNPLFHIAFFSDRDNEDETATAISYTYTGFRPACVSRGDASRWQGQ